MSKWIHSGFPRFSPTCAPLNGNNHNYRTIVIIICNPILDWSLISTVRTNHYYYIQTPRAPEGIDNYVHRTQSWCKHLRSICLCVCLSVCVPACVYLCIWNLNRVLHEHVSDLLDIPVVIEQWYTIDPPSSVKYIGTISMWFVEHCSFAMSQIAYHPMLCIVCCFCSITKLNVERSFW